MNKQRVRKNRKNSKQKNKQQRLKRRKKERKRMKVTDDCHRRHDKVLERDCNHQKRMPKI